MKALVSIVGMVGLAGVAGTAYGGPRDFIVEAGGMGGDKEVAAPYLDKFLRYIETAAGWPPNSTAGEFAPDAKAALEFIEKKKPGFGMFDPDLWLELRKKHDLQVIATVEGTRQAEKMVIVAKDPAIKSLDDLKGKKLASVHLQSPKYLSKIVFDGKIDPAKFFVLQPETSMLKSVKRVDRGEADAALLTDGEWNYPTVQSAFGKSLHVVYVSPKLPPTPVVVFNKVANAKDRESIEKALRKMCEDPKGADVCQQLDIKKFASPDKAAYDEAVRRYEK